MTLFYIAGLLVAAYLVFLVFNSYLDADDTQPESPSSPGPIVSYGACCSDSGCRDYTDTDIDVAKSECEESGGAFKAFSACIDEPCPSIEPVREAVKEVAPSKKVPQKKAIKSAPKSSVNVPRKNAKKTRRKKRDY